MRGFFRLLTLLIVGAIGFAAGVYVGPTEPVQRLKASIEERISSLLAAQLSKVLKPKDTPETGTAAQEPEPSAQTGEDSAAAPAQSALPLTGPEPVLPAVGLQSAPATTEQAPAAAGAGETTATESSPVAAAPDTSLSTPTAEAASAPAAEPAPAPAKPAAPKAKPKPKPKPKPKAKPAEKPAEEPADKPANDPAE